MNISAIIGVLIMVFGFGYFTVYFIKEVHLFNIRTSKYKKIKGTIINHKKIYYPSERAHVYYPVVKYIVDNKDYEIVSSVGIQGLFSPKKLTVLYNPSNPNEAELIILKNLLLFIIFCFLIVIVLFVFFLINDLLFEKTIQSYTYKVNCNIGGLLYEEIRTCEANSSEDSLTIISDKYKNWDAICEFTQINNNVN